VPKTEITATAIPVGIDSKYLREKQLHFSAEGFGGVQNCGKLVELKTGFKISEEQKTHGK
jgi:hypothetical protein